MFKAFKQQHGMSDGDFSLNPWTLFFNDGTLETLFQNAYFEENLQLGRALHLIAIFFYGLVAAWDAVHHPERIQTWVLVCSSVTLVFLCGLLLTYVATALYARHWQPIFAFYVLATGSGFTAVTISAAPVYPVYNFVGIIFCLFFCYGFIRLTFVWAAIAGTAIVILYTLGTWLIVSPPSDLMLNSLFYMTGINTLGMMINYSLELLYRRDFMHRTRLEYAEARTRQMNETLEQRVQERTRELVDINEELKASHEKQLKTETARRRSEKKRAALERQLMQAQKMESVGRLAGGVAHDYNNMISVIIGNAELAMDAVAPDSDLHDHLSEILEAANRSADITHQLLAFARKQTIDPKVMDLNRSVENILKMLIRLIGEDIELAWHPAPDLPPVKMDTGQIDQILANLCVNARDAVTDGGTITIETGTARFDTAYCAVNPGSVPGDYVVLAVSDNGSGMDEYTQKNLFEPFFTTKDVGQGTGLGLATVFGIVKQNNGYINVYSERGTGTTFRLYFPRHQGTAAGENQGRQDSIPESAGETVLLVEDEPAILSLSHKILTGLGYTVLSTDNPLKARKLAEEYSGNIDILMTDVIMPEMNGKQLSDIIRQTFPHIRCLFMSGYTANIIAHHGVLDKGVQFLQKPFSITQLARAVRETLDETLPQPPPAPSSNKDESGPRS